MLPLDFCSGQRKWLQMDRRVLDHDFSKKSGPIALNFLVRYNFILSCRSLAVQQEIPLLCGRGQKPLW